MTAYEKSLIIYLKKLYLDIENHKFLYNKCRICLNYFETYQLRKRACNCLVCDNCFLERYKQRELNCYICETYIRKSRIKIIQKYRKIDLPKYSFCKLCGNVFESYELKKRKCNGCRLGN